MVCRNAILEPAAQTLQPGANITCKQQSLSEKNATDTLPQQPASQKTLGSTIADTGKTEIIPHVLCLLNFTDTPLTKFRP